MSIPLRMKTVFHQMESSESQGPSREIFCPESTRPLSEHTPPPRSAPARRDSESRKRRSERGPVPDVSRRAGMTRLEAKSAWGPDPLATRAGGPVPGIQRAL